MKVVMTLKVVITFCGPFSPFHERNLKVEPPVLGLRMKVVPSLLDHLFLGPSPALQGPRRPALRDKDIR